MWAVCLALALLFSLALLVCWIRSQLTFFERHKFPHKKPTLPYGNFQSGVHIVEAFVELYEKFKTKAPAFGMHFFISPAVVVTDLRVIEDVLINDFGAFTNRGIFHNKENDPLSCHLVSLEDDEWKALRQKLIPFFSDHKMRMIFQTLMSVSEHMLTSLGERARQSVDVKEMLIAYTTDVIGNVVYGIDMRGGKGFSRKFRSMGSSLYEYKTYALLKSMLMLCCRNLSRRFGLTLIPPDISRFFLGVVRTTIQYRLENRIERKDALDILLRIELENKAGGGGKLSVEEIAAQCFVFYLYGFETAACTGTFVLYNLAMHADVQERLREEIMTTLERHEEKISYEAMLEMKYLQMVIDETLRLYPPIFDIVRKSSNDYHISNSALIIPRDTFVLIPIYCIHRDPEYYPDAEKFIPERFSNEEKSKRHPMAFIPFGAGKRNCIGSRFGMIKLKIALIQLLLNFKVSPNEKTPKTIAFDPGKPILTSASELFLTFERL